MNIIKVSELEDVIFYEYLQDFIKDLVRRQSVKFITNTDLQIQIQDLKNQIRHKDIALDSYLHEIDHLQGLLKRVLQIFLEYDNDNNCSINKDVLIQQIKGVLK